MWEKIKEIAADLYGLSALLWVEAHLILILVRGKIMIYEPNNWILGIEIAFTGGAIFLGMERLIKDIINGKHNGV